MDDTQRDGITRRAFSQRLGAAAVTGALPGLSTNRFSCHGGICRTMNVSRCSPAIEGVQTQRRLQ